MQRISIRLTNGEWIDGIEGDDPRLNGQRIIADDGRVWFVPWTSILYIKYPDEKE